MSGITSEDLGGQILGLLFSLCIVALFIVWVINTPPVIRFGITGINVIIVVFWVVSSIRKKSRLQKVRAGQIKHHITINKPR